MFFSLLLLHSSLMGMMKGQDRISPLLSSFLFLPPSSLPSCLTSLLIFPFLPYLSLCSSCPYFISSYLVSSTPFLSSPLLLFYFILVPLVLLSSFFSLFLSPLSYPLISYPVLPPLFSSHPLISLFLPSFHFLLSLLLLFSLHSCPLLPHLVLHFHLCPSFLGSSPPFTTCPSLPVFSPLLPPTSLLLSLISLYFVTSSPVVLVLSCPCPLSLILIQLLVGQSPPALRLWVETSESLKFL